MVTISMRGVENSIRSDPFVNCKDVDRSGSLCVCPAACIGSLLHGRLILEFDLDVHLVCAMLFGAISEVSITGE